MVIQAYCPMNPDKQEIAVRLLHEGMKNASENISADDLAQVKENMLKDADIKFKNNNYWVNTITTYKEYGLDVYTDFKKTVEALTPEAVSTFIREKLLSSGNHIEVIMLPDMNKE